MRVQQTLLGMPALLLMQVLLLVEHRMSGAALAPLAWYAAISWSGCAVFYVLVRKLAERISPTKPATPTPAAPTLGSEVQA